MSTFRHKVLLVSVVMAVTILAIMYKSDRFISTINLSVFGNKHIPKSTDLQEAFRHDYVEDVKTVLESDIDNVIVKCSRRLKKAPNNFENLISVYIKENVEKFSKGLRNERTAKIKANLGEPDLENRIREQDFQRNEVQEDRIRIVMYHIHHGMLKLAAAKLSMSKCYHSSNCEIIKLEENSTDPIKAEAILFQGNRMPRDLPKRLNTNQVFVYLNIESPQHLQNVQLENPYFKDFFNWTMTYRQDSDIPYLYGSVLPRSSDKRNYLSNAEKTSGFPIVKTFHKKYLTTDGLRDVGRKNYSAIFRKKNRSSVWFVSDCDTASKRELYISQMKKFTNIDIFGGCTNETNQCPKGNRQCLENVKNTYRFFLSFENSLCEDYITEKVYRWFNQDIVVVVRGARYYKRYLPDGTYIDADDFKTPADLAMFLTQLGSNEEEYIKYLKRKDNYMVISKNEHVQLAYCNLCYKLNNLERFRKEAHLLNGWWDDGKCTNPNHM